MFFTALKENHLYIFFNCDSRIIYSNDKDFSATAFMDALMRNNFLQMNGVTAGGLSGSIYQLVTNGLSHPNYLDESIVIFRGIRSYFPFLFHFFDKIPLSKQNSLRWDAAYCGVTSGAILFKRTPGLYGLIDQFLSSEVIVFYLSYSSVFENDYLHMGSCKIT